MAGKLTAIGSNCYVGSADLSGDIGAVTNLEAMLATINTTALNKGAPELINGRRDGAMAFAAFFNVDSGQEHLTFSAVPRTDVQSTVVIGTPALGSPAASMIAKQMNYAGTVGDDGSLGFTIDMEGSGYGLDFSGGSAQGDGLLTAGKETFATGTVNGTAIDLGAVSTLFGAAAYLHVFSHGSGTATFTIQDSDDNVSFAAVTGLAFTAVTGATTQRLQTAAGATIRQYVRIQKTGVSTATVAAINFVRYTEAGPI
jgi:hypothetical protein